MEDSKNNEFGVIVTDQLQVFEYQRKTARRSSRFVKWRAVSNVDELVDTFPAVAFGLEIARNMQSHNDPA
jgi:hypothetical protein